jgi:hypothetical protein
VEKKEWTPNFDHLAGAERRRARMKIHPRYGLALTDCVFMSSRDGIRWKRWDEVFISPGIEREYNWVYGDGYPALGMIETPGGLPYSPSELSMYIPENHWSMKPTKLRRYTIRMDGFVSFHAPYGARKIVLKPIVFEGSSLSVNFATSAAGFIRIRLSDGKRELNSMEIFGDSTDRPVLFKDGEVALLSGRPVVMEITMSDADIYSFKFNECP